MVVETVGTAIGGAFLGEGAAIAIAAGIAMGFSALAAAWSQGSIGSAAMGAAAERPELEGKMLLYLALPELIALLGFVIAFFLIGKLGAA
ncbi:ATPase [Candidatus Micrarchaeota archaeon]|nr:ATPase [Candidatus Micrarchaeota archaeon]